MENLKKTLLLLLALAFAFPGRGTAQEGPTPGLNYEVNRIYPHISITEEQLAQAKTLFDLDAGYKSAWVREYYSVEVMTCYQGGIRKAASKNDSLSQEQKNIMLMADAGTNIAVKVHYLPENTLKHNEPKTLNFTVAVAPDTPAAFSGGPQALRQYLQQNAMDKIPAGSFSGFDLAAVKFTVDEGGRIAGVRVLASSKNEKIDELLVKTLGNMPNWQPAAYAKGPRVKQEFVLTVGNMESCAINLLNIRRNEGEK